jgi:hypothetical protein
MTHWHLTTLEVAIVAPLLGAPIGAALTVWAQRSINKASLESQRRIAADSRLFERRALVYPGLIKSVVEFQQRLRREESWLEDSGTAIANVVADHFNEFVDNFADVVPWSSSTTIDMYEDYRESLDRLVKFIESKAALDGGPPLRRFLPATEGERMAFRAAVYASLAAAGEFLIQIHEELVGL